MRIDDIIQSKILGANPMNGIILAEFISQYKPEAYRKSWYDNSFDSIKRDEYPIEAVSDVFWHFYRTYVTPTIEEYFTWIRDLHKHLVCFEKLVGITSDGMQDFREFGDCLDNMTQILSDKEFRFTRDALDFVEHVAQFPNPDKAFDFIMRLCPTDERKNTHIDLSSMNFQPCVDLLKLYVNCNTDVLTKLRQQGEAGKIPNDKVTEFTRSAEYQKCFESTGSQLIAINNAASTTANSYLRYPELHFFSFGLPFADEHTHLSSSQPGPEGSALDQLKGRINPQTAQALNILLFYANALPRQFTNLEERVISMRNQHGWDHAREYIKHFHSTNYLVNEVQDGPVETFNVNVIVALLLGYTQMETEYEELHSLKIEPISSDAGAVPIKRETIPISEDKKPDNTVFAVVGLLALCAVFLQS